MGYRGNIAVQDNGERVYFYTHWSGPDMPETLQAALKRGKGRWNDPSYLARIIFCEMMTNTELEGQTGYGISTQPGDNECPIIVVNCDNGTVGIEADSREEFAHCKPRGTTRSYSFEEFAALPVATWKELDSGRD